MFYNYTANGDLTSNINEYFTDTVLPKKGVKTYLLNNTTLTILSSDQNVVKNISSVIIPSGTYIVYFSGYFPYEGRYAMGISTNENEFDLEYKSATQTIKELPTSTSSYATSINLPTTVIINNNASTTWYLNYSIYMTSPPTSNNYTIKNIYWNYTRIA
jgi:hypothetical protein